jgi:hypothetical protein
MPFTKILIYPSPKEMPVPTMCRHFDSAEKTNSCVPEHSCDLKEMNRELKCYIKVLTND